MGDFGFLLLNDGKKFKNHLLDIKRKPWKLLIYIFYIGLLGFILYAAFNNDTDSAQVPNLGFRQDVFSVIIKVLVFVLFAYTLHSGTKRFDGLFSMGDVNFLFPSPISSRTILAYSMLKQSFVSILSSVFIIFMFPMLQNIFGHIHPGEMLYGIVGIMTMLIFTIPLSYLTFILSTRFGIKEWLPYFFYGIVVSILGAVSYGVYAHQGVLDGVFWAFNHQVFSYIPIVGWSAELIGVMVFGKTTLSTMFLVLQVATIGILSILTIFLAQDYYEDALSSAQRMASIRQKQKEGKKFSLSDDAPNKKVRQVKVREVGYGPWAFLWMQLVTNKRANGSLLIQWKTIGAFFVSITAGLLIPEKSDSVFYGIAGGISYIMFLASADVSIEQELKMKYIFILPGRPWKKVLALNIIPVTKTIIFMTCSLLPLGLLLGVPLFSLLAGLLFPISMFVLNVFSSVIIHILIPSKFDMKAFYPVIRLLSFLLFLIPPGAAGIAVGIRTYSATLGFYTVAVINLIISMLFLWISDKVFGKLELR